MPDQDPEQLTLFQTHIAYTLRLTMSHGVQEWPLGAASNLEEATDALRGFAVFTMFSLGVYWGPEFDDPFAYLFNGVDPKGDPVRMEITMQDTYTDREGNPL